MINYFTPKGHTSFREKIEDVKKELVSVKFQMGDAAENGGDGWHDNFSFEQLQIQSQALHKRISELESVLSNIKIVEPIINSKKIAIGSKVKILRNNQMEEWEIGGYGESDLAKKILSYNTPLGEKLIGKKPGEDFLFMNSKILIKEIF